MGEGVRRPEAPSVFAKTIAAGRKAVDIPFVVSLRSMNPIGVDARSGNTVAWSFQVDVLWADASQGDDDKAMITLIQHAYHGTDGIGPIQSGLTPIYASYSDAIASRGAGKEEWHCNFDALHFTNPKRRASALKATASPDSDARRKAVLELGRSGDPQNVDLLVRLLDDSAPSVRDAAALSLARIGVEHSKLMAALVRSVATYKESISQDLAREILGAFASKGSVAAVDALAKRFLASKGEEQAKVRPALALGGKLAVPTFLRFLKEVEPGKQPWHQGVIGLGEAAWPDPDAVRVLVAQLDRVGYEWCWIAVALVRMNAHDATDALIAKIEREQGDKSAGLDYAVEKTIEACKEKPNDFATDLLTRLTTGSSDVARQASTKVLSAVRG
jgi:hypothetical protein